MVKSEIYLVVGSIILAIIIVVRFWKISRLQWYYPEKETPKGNDIENSIDVMIKNLATEKEVLGYYDVTLGRYYGFDGVLVEYDFVWRYIKVKKNKKRIY